MNKIITLLIPAVIFISACQSNTTDLSVEAMPNDLFAGKEIVDLSHDYSDETVYWVTSEEFEMDTVFAGTTDKGYYYSAYNFSTAEHGGTHIDAPVHFAENARSVDQIPLENLVGPAIKVDVSSLALNNPDYQISISDLQTWEANHNSEIPNAAIVLLYTGFSSFYPDRKRYLGTDQRGDEALADLHFPGLSPAAAKWLVENRNIHAIGIDSPSIDYGQSTDFQSHVVLMTKNIPAFENLASLEKLPTSGFNIVALPMKIKGGSGAPLRIIAIVDAE